MCIKVSQAGANGIDGIDAILFWHLRAKLHVEGTMPRPRSVDLEC